jgi:hypothetical protein
MRTPRESALLIALLFKRANKTRARISDKTVLILSKRKKYLRASFVELLTAELDDLGFVLVELNRGGFGLIPISALNGAPAITASKFIKDELIKLREKEIDFADIIEQLDTDSNENEDEDENN